MRDPDRLELLHPGDRAGHVSALDRCAHHVLEHDALQVEGQRLQGRRGIAKAGASRLPLALPRVGQRAPERRIVLITDERMAEILERGIEAADRDLGDRTQHQQCRILGGRRLLRQRHVEHGLGLNPHAAREIEAGKVGAGDGALARRRLGGGAKQLRIALAELGAAVRAPALRIEHMRLIGTVGARRVRDRRERESARPGDHDLVGRELDGEIVGCLLYTSRCV